MLMSAQALQLAARLTVLACALAVSQGCALMQRKAVGMVASTLASSGDVFTRDDDLELVGEAIPFGLKLYESLLDSAPTNKDLLIATCSNFTQYGVAYLETEAAVLGEAQHHDEVVHLNARALKLYLRAKGYCVRAMEVRFPGIGQKLLDGSGSGARQSREEGRAAAVLDGGVVGLGHRPRRRQSGPRHRHADGAGARGTGACARRQLEQGDAARDVRVARQPARRARRIPERAREHFTSAVELQKGLSPGPYVALALGVAVPAQDREEFEKLLNEALAIDPEKDPSKRLVTLVQQRRARALLDQIDTNSQVSADPSSAFTRKVRTMSASHDFCSPYSRSLWCPSCSRPRARSSSRRSRPPTRRGTRRCSRWATRGTRTPTAASR